MGCGRGRGEEGKSGWDDVCVQIVWHMGGSIAYYMLNVIKRLRHKNYEEITSYNYKLNIIYS